MSREINLFVLLMLISGSFAVPVSAFEELGEVLLKPMEKPSPLPMVTGTELYWLKDGKEYIIYHESVDSKMSHTRASDGCSWTRMTGMFAPSLEYYDCYQERSVTQEIIRTKGSPWPLNEKSEFEYEFAGEYDDGFDSQWQGTRFCKVEKQVRVRVPAGEFDTYRLACEDEGNTMTYWIAPQLGHRVAFRIKVKWFMSRSYMLELVKVVNP
jgi:hypothetical protein